VSGPSLAIVRLLEACNAGCFMCSFARSDHPQRMTLAEGRSLAARLGRSPIRAVRFTGGEPLLVAWLPELVSAFAARGMLTSVITNGWHLPPRVASLDEAGLDQVIVSLDGATARTHDRARGTAGLFDRACAGLAAARDHHARIRTRVNTVAGPHNVHELPALWERLRELHVEQWSIIPLKRAEGAWRSVPREALAASTTALSALAARGDGPTFVGFSSTWAGRTAAEQGGLADGDRPFTPHGPCRLVDHVRYVVPEQDRVYPCNCVPHRTRDAGMPLYGPVTDDAFAPSGLSGPRAWLRDHGPAICRGCEPANVALAEGRIALDDPFAF
jgi:cytosylglucuronate decarboxylase